MTKREQFKFIEAVRSEFRWLSNYGFRCTSEEATLVRYESDISILNIYHGHSSYEIAAEFGRLSLSSQTFSVSEIISLSDPEVAKRYRNYAATTPNAVEEGVKRLSEIIKKYADFFLSDSSSVFTKLEEQKKKWSKNFAAEVLSKQVRPKAEEAFRNKNYVEAAKLYESIESELSISEYKKLKYARKYLLSYKPVRPNNKLD